jgi:small multidrug resistance pump
VTFPVSWVLTTGYAARLGVTVYEDAPHDNIIGAPIGNMEDPTKRQEAVAKWGLLGIGGLLLIIAMFTDPVGSSPDSGILALGPYSVAFFFLSLTLKTTPVGIAYAIWSGAGIVLISFIGYLFFKQTLDLRAIIGILLIVSGVIVINVFSKSVSH